MDFFTHLLLGFVIALIVDGPNFDLSLVAAIFMSQLSDLDFMLFPLWKKLPFTGHHGITHTPIFVLSVSFLISIIFYLLGWLDKWLLLILFLSGAVHIFGDFLGTGGVPLLYPLNKNYYKKNIDLGVSPVLMLFSLAGITSLIRAQIGSVYGLGAREVAFLLAGIFVAYYSGRAALKLYLEKKPENQGFTALPTPSPLKWKYARKVETAEEIIVYLKTKEGLKPFPIPKARKKAIRQREDLLCTYWHPLVQAEMRFFEFPCYRLNCEEGRMEITWNSAEAGKVMDVQAIYENGELRVIKRFRKKRMRIQ